MDMFAIATKEKYRFNTTKGKIGVEDLWDLPLSANTERPNLDDIARELHKKIQAGAEISFVKKETAESAEFTMLQNKFNIVKFIIDVKLGEAERAKKAKEVKEKNKRILELIAQKDDESLAAKTREELLGMLKDEQI